MTPTLTLPVAGLAPACAVATALAKHGWTVAIVAESPYLAAPSARPCVVVSSRESRPTRFVIAPAGPHQLSVWATDDTPNGGVPLGVALDADEVHRLLRDHVTSGHRHGKVARGSPDIATVATAASQAVPPAVASAGGHTADLPENRDRAGHRVWTGGPPPARTRERRP